MLILPLIFPLRICFSSSYQMIPDSEEEETQAEIFQPFY